MNDPTEELKKRQQARLQKAATPPIEDDELTPPPITTDQQGREIYQAFRPSPRKCDRLEIRTNSGVWQYPRYFDLRDISVDGRKWTQIVLHYPLYDVFIAGRNLHHLLYTLRQSRCDNIQEFKADLFSPENPEGQEAAFIQSIDIKVKQPAPPHIARRNEEGNSIN